MGYFGVYVRKGASSRASGRARRAMLRAAELNLSMDRGTTGGRRCTSSSMGRACGAVRAAIRWSMWGGGATW